eukprot:snap_masked-scaffold_64-processed-gene-0.51-mRNA-1 protein AED:1.00 eAED:1.00 QI:0/0/0/0/1/1/2/0/77
MEIFEIMDEEDMVVKFLEGKKAGTKESKHRLRALKVLDKKIKESIYLGSADINCCKEENDQSRESADSKGWLKIEKT